ncbi:MAG: hypothetical protein NVS3B20_00710 [Polyangiales bacterium]
MIAPRDRPFTFAEATLVRATAFLHLLLVPFGLLMPASVFAPYGLPNQEPATFARFAVVVYGTMGIALLRALRLPRDSSRLLIETTALIKLSFVAVVVADTLAHKLPSRALIAVALDLTFGAALFRLARN